MRSWARGELVLMRCSTLCGHGGRGCRRPVNGTVGAIITAAASPAQDSAATLFDEHESNLKQTDSESFDPMTSMDP